MSLRNQILVGDVRDRLDDIPPGSVDTVITSPPYFNLRDYGSDRQIGLEATVDGWAEELRLVMLALRRVMKATGVVWVNLGDTYSRKPAHGADGKSLLLGPERFALRLIEDGWLIRNKVVWKKSNPMPSSVRDRLSGTWEVIYMLSLQPSYFFDLDAIRVPHRSSRPPRKAPRLVPHVYPAPGAGSPDWGTPQASNRSLAELNDRGQVGHPLGKNPGDVWETGTAAFRGAHFATFPISLLERPLLGSCPEKVCAGCGKPWQREPMRKLGELAVRGELRKDCECDRGWRPGLVLDPFLGSGTVALAAIDHDRDWLGIELNPDYAALAQRRIDDALGGREFREAA